MCAALSTAGACTCGDAALSVTVQVAPRAATTRCVTVAARPSVGAGEEVSTAPIPRPPGRDSVAVAVYQGTLPESISVLARGYDDPACTRLNEESVPSAVTFARGSVPTVTLHLNGSPCVGADAGTACPGGVCRSDQACVDAGTEFNCVNGTDDDGDGRSDCFDADCLSVTCTVGNQCLLSPVCQVDGGCGGPSRTCDTPPGFCFVPTGTCSPGSGTCSYAGDTSKSCDDSNACTNPDNCLADGGCGGPAVSCGPPPGQCYEPSPGCHPVLGCQYPIRVNGGCNDGDACTFGDRCDGDAGCAGTLYSCPSTECASSTCLGDGGCSASSVRTGLPCDAGLCLASGTCLTFPYAPSNFDPVTVAAGGISGNVALSCNAWFNSTDGGRSWCTGATVPVVSVVAQDAGPDAVVLAMSGLSLSGTLTLVGERPVILAVWGDVSLSGTISARSGTTTDAGAGSHPDPLCDAQNGLVEGTTSAGGGGGGSYGGRGEDGGHGSGNGRGGRRGSAFGNPQIVPLLGGCNGGNGGRSSDTSATGGLGGAGGGAVQISAAGRLNISGTVTASGAGGRGGNSGSGGNGGGAGGSGGAVLLEGWDIAIAVSADLTANGGGGGEGANLGGTDGENGGDGSSIAATPAPPGNNNTSCGGNGGQGASAQAVAQAGLNGNSDCGGGGGGGGLGRIRVNGPNLCQVDAGIQSPLATFGGNCP